MEPETIKKEDVRKRIVELLNRSLQLEYDFLFGYPRVIDKLVNIDKIHDKQIVEAIEVVVKESLIHFDDIDKIIGQLGGKTIWHINVVGWLADVEECLLQLLDKENLVISWYQASKQVAERSKVKAGGLLSKLTASTDKLSEDFIDVNKLIGILDRHIIEEEGHIRLITDAVNKLRMLKNK